MKILRHGVLLMMTMFVDAMRDACYNMACAEEGMVCRILQVCQKDGMCRIAVPTCVVKDTSYRVPNICNSGYPVINMAGREVTCGGSDECPMGFFCRGGFCCPGQDTGDLNSCQSLLKPTSNLPVFPPFEVCMNQCLDDSHCAEGEMCCARDCGSKCMRFDPKALASPPSASSTSPDGDNDPGDKPPPPDAYLPSASSIPGRGDDVLPVNGPSFSNEDIVVGHSTIGGHGETDTDHENAHSPLAREDHSVTPGKETSDNLANIEGATIPGHPNHGIQNSVIAGPSPKERSSGPIKATDSGLNLPSAPSITKPKASGVVNNGDPVSKIPLSELGNPAEDHPQKAGRCPAKPKMVICGQRPCDRDSLCPGPTKCCPTHCGQLCVTPEETTQRLNNLQGNVFRDIGFGQPRPFGQSNNPTNSGVFGNTIKSYGLDFAMPRSKGGNTPRLGPQNFGFASSQPNYGGLYKPEEGPLYQYGFRQGNSGTGFPSSQTSNIGSNNQISKSGQTGNVNEIFGSSGDNSKKSSGKNDILGYPLPFPSPAAFPAYGGTISGGESNEGRDSYGNAGTSSHSRNSNSRSNGASAGSSFGSSAGSSFGGIPGYGPNGFSDGSSKSIGRGYGTIDPGAFGSISKSDYEKLGLDTVYNSFNQTKDERERSSGSKDSSK